MITCSASKYIVSVAINRHVGCFLMDSMKMPLQDLTITYQLFQMVAEISEDEKYS